MTPQRILVVDDERHILDVVVYILEEHGFVVETALDGAAALARLECTEPALAILDLTLPGMDGLTVFSRMRAARPALPIVMLTARGEEVDRVLGLELGADDYVTKPFSPRELAARVRAVLRRAGAAGAGGERDASVVTQGPLRLDRAAFALCYFDEALTLTRAEFRIMESLVRHPARVFTRDALIDRIYDGEHVVSDRSIDAAVKRLRRKFVAVRPGVDPIETVYGLGYKLSRAMEAAP